jgi:alpha 1,3-glucosidase
LLEFGCEVCFFVCRRNRALSPGTSAYEVVADSLKIEADSASFDLLNAANGVTFLAEIFPLRDRTVRIKVNEKNPIRERYEVKGALVGEPTRQRWEVSHGDGSFTGSHSNCTTIVTFKPFRVDFLINKELVATFNSKGLLNFEHYREKAFPPTPPPQDEFNKEDLLKNEEETDGNGEDEEDPPIEDDDEGEETVSSSSSEDSGMWSETFKSHHDSKPYGPSSVGADISFPGVEHVYGIPEHADTLALKMTKGSTDPYRLYNLDVFEYELYNPMALYGSIPYMIAHGPTHTVGVFWHNGAETWIDTSLSKAKEGILGSLVSYFQGSDDTPQVDTHWFSESGIIDVFVMMGPRPHNVFKQYSSLTGTTQLPPLFSLAYHQSRWNYNDEKDVLSVNSNFDEFDIPMDVIWLDIEHTDSKKYFTWDASRFPDSSGMIDKVASFGRKMVTIIDPHIKRESGYFVHDEATSKGIYVKKSDSSGDYEGHCWPGSSSWLDFMDPNIRQHWASLFNLRTYQGSTLDLYTWNDMNEPSVFNGPEITMHKDARHYQGFEHRDVHNVYGMFVHQASTEGQIMRSNGEFRPFVLSRAFYAGSQRFGAIWTGDNTADWEHLAISLPMIMSIGVAGLPFAGADVGGFFKDPSTELLVRWYQAGAFYPFFRAHAHLDTKRREPWLFGKDTAEVIRSAIRQRYEYLPLWYTLFYESSKTGSPVMRPLWVEFNKDINTYSMDDECLIGNSLLVKPVTKEGVTSVDVYFPGPSSVWYDVETYASYPGNRRATINTPLSKIPVFQFGGTVVPKKLRVRRSSSLMLNDPYTLIVALDPKGKAKGYLYTDDGLTLSHEKGVFLYRKFEFNNNQFISSSAEPSGQYKTKEWLERIIVLGLQSKPRRITMKDASGTKDLGFSFSDTTMSLTIRKPGCNIGEDFIITLE